MVGFAIALIVFGWAIYGLHTLDLHKPVIEALYKPVADWLVEPGNIIRVALWIASLLAVVAVFFIYDKNTPLGQFRGEIMSMAITIIIIDELNRYRSSLEREEDITEQIESRVSDVAVEAVRIAKKLGFLDKAIKKANLREAQLKGVDLSGMNLKEKDLSQANLEGAKLNRANLERANLDGANFRGATLYEANFEGSYLYRTDLNEALLWRTSFKDAYYNYKTVWPNSDEGEDAKAQAILEPEG